MKHILSGPFHRSVFFAPDGGSSGGDAGTTAAPDTAAGGDLGSMSRAPVVDTSERVEGEVKPSFEKLGGKKTTPESKTEPQVSSQTTPEPKVEQKAKPEPEVKKVEETAKKAAETPDPKKTDKVAEPAKKQAADPKAKQDEGKETEIPDKDDDVDAIQPNPGAPATVVKSLNDMKGIVKTTREQARKIKAELETTKAELEQAKAGAGKLSPEVETKIKRAEEILLTFEAENNEDFRKEYDTKIVQAEENIFSFLKQHGMKDEVIEEIKEAGVDNWGRWDELLEKFKSGLTRQDLIDAIRDRKRAIGAKQTKLQELASNREKALGEFGEREKRGRLEWAEKAISHSNKIIAKEDWILEENIPSDATPEEKQAIEENNARKKAMAVKYNDNVRDCYNRNPERTAEIAIAALKTEFMEEEFKRVSGELEKAQARVAELEERIGKARKVGQMAHVEPAETSPEKKEVQIGGSGEAAIRGFKWGQGKKK